MVYSASDNQSITLCSFCTNKSDPKTDQFLQQNVHGFILDNSTLRSRQLLRSFESTDGSWSFLLAYQRYLYACNNSDRNGRGKISRQIHRHLFRTFRICNDDVRVEFMIRCILPVLLDVLDQD